MRFFITVFMLMAFGVTASAAFVSTADAQSKRRRRPPASKPQRPAKASQGAALHPQKAKVFDFAGLDVSGQLRTPQLLYFLERASEELERALLERRSFIPELVRSIDEEGL